MQKGSNITCLLHLINVIKCGLIKWWHWTSRQPGSPSHILCTTDILKALTCASLLKQLGSNIFQAKNTSVVAPQDALVPHLCIKLQVGSPTPDCTQVPFQHITTFPFCPSCIHFIVWINQKWPRNVVSLIFAQVFIVWPDLPSGLA